MNFDLMDASDNVLISKAHTLYVEGKLDEVVANILFPEISVKQLGGSGKLVRVSEQNLNPSSKEYYLIDRDYRSDESVEGIWQSFLDVNKSNLITWKLREIENYFIFPNILEMSEYFNGNHQSLKNELERIINKNYLTDIANDSIYSVISKRFTEFKDLELEYPTEVMSDQDMKCRIEENENLLKYLNDIKSISMCNIIELFTEKFEKVKTDKVNHGIFSDEFLKYVKGKKVLNEIVDSCMFDKKSGSGKTLNISERIERIVKKLLEDNKNLHGDFGKLRDHVYKRIKLSN